MIELGAMGLGIAKILRDHGYIVCTCGVRPGAAADFAKEGGVACVTPAEVTAGVDVVVSVVVSTAQTGAVLFGEVGVTGAMRRGSTFVMYSTVGPNWSVALKAYLAQQSVLYVDGPISDDAAKAASNQMTMMISVTPEAYAAAGDVLDAMTDEVYHLGDKAGAGSKVKIINQLLAGMHTAAAAEAITLGLHEGVAADALCGVITHSTNNSWMFENYMTHVLAGDYTPLSAVGTFVRDLGLILDTAYVSKFPLPLATAVYQMFIQAFTTGYARKGDSAAIKIFPEIILPKGQPK